jgi:hypothetical protein
VKHFAPHDANQREKQTGKTLVQFAATRGIRFEVVPSVPILDGILSALASCSRSSGSMRATASSSYPEYGIAENSGMRTTGLVQPYYPGLGV